MSKLPGHAGLSVLGDHSVDFYRDPVGFVRRRVERHGARLFQARLLNRPTAFICSVRGMRELLCEKSSVFLKDPTDLMTNVYGDTVVTSNGEEACLLRLSLSSLFSTSCLESWTQHTNSVCERHLQVLADSQCVYSLFKALATELVLGLFLNVRPEEEAELFQEITQLCTQHWHGLISAPVSLKVPMWSSGFCTALEARERLVQIIRDKLDQDKRGFVGALGSLPLPESSSASQHLLLFISALIPKALASTLTSFTLALSGEQQDETRRRARTDPDFLQCVLLEVQRLWPPFIGGRRLANQDSTIGGFSVPKGYAVIYISQAIHRDPEVFHQPDHFLPERWSGSNSGQQHLLCSLGNGPRNCIGSRLTETFLKVVCSFLLQRYDWRLDPPSQDVQYKWLPVSRPAQALTVCWSGLDWSGLDRTGLDQTGLDQTELDQTGLDRTGLDQTGLDRT